MGAGVPHGLQNQCDALKRCRVDSILKYSRHFLTILLPRSYNEWG